MPDSGLVLVSAFVLAVWIVAQQMTRQQRLKMTFDFNNRLLDRSSVKDFSDFLQTEQGAKFVESLTAEREASGPSQDILRAVRTGTVLASLGLGTIILTSYIAFERREAMTAIGVISLALGCGFLVSGMVSYRLARTLGVLQGTARQTDTRVVDPQ